MKKIDFRERKPLTIPKVIAMAVAAGCLTVLIWLAWLKTNPDWRITSFDDCIAAANPVDLNSVPAVCETKSGKQFTHTYERRSLGIREWGIRLPITDAIKDAYQAHNAEADTVTVSTRALDAVTSGKEECLGAPLGIVLQRAKPGDQKDGGQSRWTEEELVTLGQPIGGYYYFEKLMAETACAATVSKESVGMINRLRTDILTGLKSLRS